LEEIAMLDKIEEGFETPDKLKRAAIAHDKQ
jgi:hypothetical protein